MTEDDDDFAKMFAESEAGGNKHKKKKELQVGDLVRARIVSIGQEAAFVDLGAKSEGMIDIVELRDDKGKILAKVGDEIEARVVDNGGKSGCVVLRRSMGKGPQAKAELEQAAQAGIPVEGVVTGVNKGGVEVQVAGERGFCPISQLELRHVDDAAGYVGQKLVFKITRYEVGRQVNLVLSRRAVLEEEQRGRALATRDRLIVGAVLQGTVTTIKDYGAFVDLGGIEGMLHVSELGFQRVSHPRDVLAVGQSVEVAVLKIEGEPGAKGAKIALSLKSLAEDPWANVPDLFPPGRKVAGKVVRVEVFGAFVEIAPGLEGLVHISEMGAGKHVQHPREVCRPGQAVEVTVLSIDREKRRIALGMGVREDEIDAEGAAKARAPVGFGTFADLLKPKK